MKETLPSALASTEAVLMCGCACPVIVDRYCLQCGLPSLQALVSYRPVVRVLDAATVDSIRRCGLEGCEHHHHAKDRCRTHYDEERRAPAL